MKKSLGVFAAALFSFSILSASDDSSAEAHIGQTSQDRTSVCGGVVIGESNVNHVFTQTAYQPRGNCTGHNWVMASGQGLELGWVHGPGSHHRLDIATPDRVQNTLHKGCENCSHMHVNH